ncbi:MAG TPA: Rne/Rng family ribonuclease [Rickettsiales bacterium]|nr:Rne/Rng family ribonuclease [Rickettsiales bacterium]
MNKKILIDGAFKEETRVALLSDGVLEDYDREDFNFKQLKGNIYLAKITRIEPSLQAAFIEYGGDKHGFLPFSDIHPDYYNIPKEEIKDLKKVKFFQNNEVNNPIKENIIENLQENETQTDNQNNISEKPENSIEEVSTFSTEDENNNMEISNYPVDEETEGGVGYHDYSQYKIEDVIKEGQFVLVQVLKEERGNKGVAMTTYISIAGKYCVLMVNSPERGGVSKKVTNINDRKILKSILRSLNVSSDKSIILRTAGVGKKPEEILKDYLYLLRLWNAIKDTALESKAFTFIHAEDDIIKRTIRDLYTDDVDEIIVEGEEVYKLVKGLLKIIETDKNPNIRLHNDKTPLFQRYSVENQLLELYNNKVNLPSGGSIVIDQTEALVAIDVNSAKAIKEKGVEEMATATNIEAAKEIAKQLKLRDLAGLVVIDFIDMFEIKNRRLVEKAMRDAMMSDKARIQIARLSAFGLMELSRQRLGASFMERTSEVCPRCKGKGKIKAKEIIAMSILRAIKYATLDKQINIITVETTSELANYLLNFKRKTIYQIEKDYNVYIFVEENSTMEDNNYNLKKRKGLTPDEKKELDPQEKTGKVNSNFNDDNLYSVSNNEIKKYKFDNESYGNNNKNNLRRVNNKKQFNKYKINNNNNNNCNQKKNNWFKKLFGMN